MNKTLKMPWGIEDTTENLKEVKEILKTYLRKSNYEGKGESDVAEAEIDFNRAIEALEKQIPKKPKEYEDKYYACPVCGNVVLHKWEKYPEKLTDKNDGLPYCLGCGQALDWGGKQE